ncbi:hypothetical protein Tco_0059612 [Tanacetum coccineum]
MRKEHKALLEKIQKLEDQTLASSEKGSFTRVSGHKKAEHELKTQSRRKELLIHSYRVAVFILINGEPWSSQQWQYLVYDESDSVPHAHAQSF